jgi:hypothetical protein
LLAEDNRKGVPQAFKSVLADEVFVARDGAEVLDFHQRGQSPPSSPSAILFLDLKCQMNGLEVLLPNKEMRPFGFCLSSGHLLS